MVCVRKDRHTANGSCNPLLNNGCAMLDKRLYRLLIFVLLFLFVCSGCAKRVEISKIPPQKKPAGQDSVTKAPPQKKNPYDPSSIAGQFYAASLELGAPIFIRIFKESRELELWVEKGETFVLFKTYRIACFSGSLGPKLREGDRQAPEGFYFVSPSRMNPYSRFHLAFNIGYPNRYDRAHHRTGGDIMVHGNTVSIGCFAMTDRIIEEIYTIAEYAFKSGQPFFRVHIFPFRMTEENMQRHLASPHIEFWKNLQAGYEFFEKLRRPPNVNVKHRRYTFEYEPCKT